VTPRHNTPEQFAHQLREGHYNELRVALFFMLQGAHVRIGYEHQRYDLHVIPPEGDPFSIEVKWDKRAGETGNLFFEIRNTRQDIPSGIAATPADFWCHVIGDGDEALFVSVKRLRRLLDRRSFRVLATRGADSNSLGKLVPLAWLTEQPGVRILQLPTVESFFGELFRRGQG
jgi:hypothetical protein